ncbi:MAG: preprotein translocase subunit YajC [Brachymonas sp.]|nr:preprotein translocase subunit YajC [Brachymonas sp.]
MSVLVQMGPMLLIFIAGFFLMIRPQMKKQKELRSLLDNLGTGDEVVTASGLLGKVTGVKGDNLEVQIAKGVEVQMQKTAVTQILPKGTIRF